MIPSVLEYIVIDYEMMYHCQYTKACVIHIPINLLLRKDIYIGIITPANVKIISSFMCNKFKQNMEKPLIVR